MKIRNILPEFKIAGQPDPKDAADYKEKMKTLQQIQNNPRMRDPETQATIAKRKEELRKWAEKNLPKEEILDIDESGIMYRAGVKKYGKEGMRKIQSAAGKGASHQEIGKIKDKYLKDSIKKPDSNIDKMDLKNCNFILLVFQKNLLFFPNCSFISNISLLNKIFTNKSKNKYFK